MMLRDSATMLGVSGTVGIDYFPGEMGMPQDVTLEMDSRTVEDREQCAYRKPTSNRPPNRWN